MNVYLPLRPQWQTLRHALFCLASLEIICLGAPEWLSQLNVQLLILAQVMISQFMSLSPTLGSVLTEPGWDFLPPFLSAPSLLTCSLSLKIKKQTNKKTICLINTGCIVLKPTKRRENRGRWWKLSFFLHRCL